MGELVVEVVLLYTLVEQPYEFVLELPEGEEIHLQELPDVCSGLFHLYFGPGDG